MEKTEKSCNTGSGGFSAGFVVCLALILLLVAFISYGGVYVTGLSAKLQQQNDVIGEIQTELHFLKKRCLGEQTLQNQDVGKREVISSSNVESLKGLLRGPPGQPGRDGRDGNPGKDGAIGATGSPGLPGRDGKDFASLNLLRGIINETVGKEWSKLSTSLPAYSGATFTRRGKKSCPKTSDTIYRGQMVGKDFRAAGGGVNYQCLSEDPEYYPLAPQEGLSSLRATLYIGTALSNHRVPCAVCESQQQRVSKLMIPAKTRCPTDEWTLEYQGYLMSSAEHNGKGDDFFSSAHHSGFYVCVDLNMESLTGTAYSMAGSMIYRVNAACSGPGALNNCPPYRQGPSISCVVCTK